MTAEQITDVLDELSESYVKLATELWDEGRIRANRGEISRDDFKRIRAEARAIIRRSVEIVTSASFERLNDIQDSLSELEGITSDLKKTRDKISSAENVLKVAMVAVASVTMIVASVTAPNPTTIGGAVLSVGELVAAIGVAAG